MESVLEVKNILLVGSSRQKRFCVGARAIRMFALNLNLDLIPGIPSSPLSTAKRNS